MKEEPAGWCPSFDGIGEALELDALFVQLAYQIDQVLDTAAKAIQFPDDKRVAVTQHFERFVESGPLGATAADLVVEDPLAACLGQGVEPEDQEFDPASRRAHSRSACRGPNVYAAPRHR